MTNAGETVGRAVGTGLRTLRHGAIQVGHAGVEAVREATAETQAEVVKTTRKARKHLAKDARRTTKTASKDLARGAKRARKHAGRTAKDARGAANDLMAAAKSGGARRGRKWPWLLGIGVVAVGAGAAYALKSSQQVKLSAPEPEESLTDQQRIATNGSAPHPTQEQPTDSPASNRN
ncbi:MAG TPA: hypothetical protein VFX16_35960 [Pseudonocardiaceae bacterium]|nr:hypothetical protein [Pseudonocardiaceae bacterium]